MGGRQKGKHHKRKKSWHRGRGEARRWFVASRDLARAEKNGRRVEVAG